MCWIRQTGICVFVACLVATTISSAQDAAMMELPHTVPHEPPRIMRSEAMDREFEIQVSLPHSYSSTAKTYPVLYVTDGSVAFRGAASGVRGLMESDVPELIVVGIGCPRDVTLAEFQKRRNYEFTPSTTVFFEGPGPEKTFGGRLDVEPDMAGGAPLLLDFIVDEVMPVINKSYRVDTSDQGICGASGGGGFVGYALFARPGAFQKYIIGSPNLNTGDFMIFDMEAEYAKNHDDLDASVFLGAGEAETDTRNLSTWGLVSSMARMAETLRIREYPSLHLETRIFPGEEHSEACRLSITWGVRTLWGSDARTPLEPQAGEAQAEEDTD